MKTVLKLKDVLLQELKDKEETLKFLNYKIELYKTKTHKNNM